MTLVVTRDGRLVGGIVKEESQNAVTLQTPNELVVVPRGEIRQREQLPVSLMPEDILTKLPLDEARDLIAYLMQN